MAVLQPVSAKSTDAGYYGFMDSARSEEKARFDYNNLCFYVDTCYGRPEISRLSASIAESGLDKTLDQAPKKGLARYASKIWDWFNKSM